MKTVYLFRAVLFHWQARSPRQKKITTAIKTAKSNEVTSRLGLCQCSPCSIMHSCLLCYKVCCGWSQLGRSAAVSRRHIGRCYSDWSVISQVTVLHKDDRDDVSCAVQRTGSHTSWKVLDFIQSFQDLESPGKWVWSWKVLEIKVYGPGDSSNLLVV